MGAAASEDPETEFYGAIGSSLFNVVRFLLSREWVRVRVPMPRPLRRLRNPFGLIVAREPGDECQRRVAAGSDSGRREEELPGLVLVEDPSRPRLPEDRGPRGLRSSCPTPRAPCKRAGCASSPRKRTSRRTGRCRASRRRTTRSSRARTIPRTSTRRRRRTSSPPSPTRRVLPRKNNA